jgi:hypothetical protein
VHHFFKLNEVSAQIGQSFHYLPEDNYLKTDFIFRKRLYSTGKICYKNIIFNEKNEPFVQNGKINQYIGGVKREYMPLTENTQFYVKYEIILPVLEYLPEGNYQFGIHQIRILADDEHVGKPAPEGIHQDGFDYILVACYATINVAGGNSILVDANSHSKIYYDKVLHSGECLLFDDKKYAHYASPIVPKIPGSCYRDVFIVTLEKDNFND